MQKEDDSEGSPLDQYQTDYRSRMQLRNPNFNNKGPSPNNKPRIAQIKAIQKFIGRLKSDNKNQEAILTQMDTLNLSKYLQQISSLMAVCINERDIRFYTEVATRLNRDYEDFPQMLLKDLLKQWSNAYQASEDNKPRLKSLLLFTTELFVCGFPFPYKDISQMLKKLVKAGTKKKNNFTTEKELRLFAYYYNCDIYASFLRQFGTIFTVSRPTWMSTLIDQGYKIDQYPLMIPNKTRQDYTNIFFTNYISSCSGVLDSAFERIKELEDELRDNLKMSGQFNRQVQLNYNELKEKFLFTKECLCLIIEMISSTVVVKQYEDDLVDKQQIMKKYINKVDNAEIFQNEFERELYTELSELSKTENKAAGQEEYRQFKDKLDACKNKHQSDQTIHAFQGINNKRTRKMLAKDILEYRKQYQLVTPFLCRIASTVGLIFRDLVDYLLQLVFAEYQKLRQTVSTTFVVNDKKSRNLKYICEFTKFKIIDPERTIGVIQNLIDDLKGYNIELLIAALQSVGRFLYLAPLHANKFTFMLSKLENVMKQKSFPLFTTSQLLNSINLLKPHVEIPKPEEPPPTPIERQASAVLKLDVINQIEGIIKGILKLIDRDGGLQAVRRQLLKSIENYDFLGNYHYAYLLNELQVDSISDWIVEQTVQKLGDAIINGNYQNCLLWSRFFGELFKYGSIKRSFLYEQLRRFIGMDKGEIGVINLVCTVLQTCEEYLDSKKISVRNQTFLLLVEFKKYIHRCKYIPMLEQFKIIDVFEQLQVNLANIKLETLLPFVAQYEKTNLKEVDLSKALDNYLDKGDLKEHKNGVKEEPQDTRTTAKEVESEQVSEERNSEQIANQARMFDSEFLNIMNSHIKDLSGRIAKPAIVEKVIEKKRDRKKAGEGEQKKTVIGRCGGKFIKREVIFKSKTGEEESRVSKQE